MPEVLFTNQLNFTLRYTGAYEGYPAPRDGYGGRRYEIFFYLQTIIANSLQVISPVSMIRSTNSRTFEVTSSIEAALVAYILVLLMRQGKSPLGSILLSKFPRIQCEKNCSNWIKQDICLRHNFLEIFYCSSCNWTNILKCNIDSVIHFVDFPLGFFFFLGIKRLEYPSRWRTE